MNSKSRRYLRTAGIAFGIFLVLLFFVLKVDVKPIGPYDSEIGCAGINKLIHEMTGVHMSWYKLTNGLGLLSIAICGSFGLVGFFQWVKRGEFDRVDKNIIILGFFYIVVMAAFAFFEVVIVNRRPILMDGELEASFPSSHTMLTCCVMASTITQLRKYVKNVKLRETAEIVCVVLIIVAVVGRFLSGAHWFTDILAGILLSVVFVNLYKAVLSLQRKKAE